MLGSFGERKAILDKIFQSFKTGSELMLFNSVYTQNLLEDFRQSSKTFYENNVDSEIKNGTSHHSWLETIWNESHYAKKSNLEIHLAVLMFAKSFLEVTNLEKTSLSQIFNKIDRIEDALGDRIMHSKEVLQISAKLEKANRKKRISETASDLANEINEDNKQLRLIQMLTDLLVEKEEIALDVTKLENNLKTTESEIASCSKEIDETLKSIYEI